MKSLLIIIGIFLLTSFNLVNAQTAPVASNVAILGEALFNSAPNPDEATILTGSYDFSDDNGDAEGTSTYKWYRDIDGDGPEPGEEIAGATSFRYTVQSGDVGYNIYFEVTPVDDSPQTGTALASVSGVLANTTSFTNANVSGVTNNSDNDYLNTTMNNNTTFTINGSGTDVIIHGDFDLDGKNGITINVTNGATLIVQGQLITKNNVTINVDSDATFTIESGLQAKNGSTLDISGNMAINGDVTVQGNATFTVAAGGSFDVAGDVTLGTGGDVTLDGDMTVGGDFDTGSGGTITVGAAGSLAIDGDLLGDAAIEGTGPVTVGGQVSGSINDTEGNQLTVLPIELVSFKTTLFRNKVILHWITASEENNDYFTIERSSDGMNFRKVTQIDGAGNSFTRRNYSFIDESPDFGINYYRLKQTDYNGQFSYSEIKTIANNNAAEFEIGPNPATDYINITSPSEMAGTVKLLSHTGGVVLEIALEGTKQTIDLSSVNAGQYLIVFSSGKGFITKKIKIQ